MLDNITLNKIKALRLNGMLEGFEHIREQEALHGISFTDGLTLLIDRETHYRANRRLARLQQAAKLRYSQAMIEDISTAPERRLTREHLDWLCRGQWLLNHENISLTGPTGVGKTFIACACGALACRMGRHTRYYRLSKLLELIRIAKADGSYTRFTKGLLKVECLVLDDWGIDSIGPEYRAPLLEIIDDRYDERSVIIASQLPIEHWHDYLGNSTIADAILDRLIHKAKRFNLKGESMRKKID